MIPKSNIDFVYDSEGLELNPNPREINKNFNEIVKNVQNIMNLFPKNLTERENAIFMALEPLFDAIKKYSNQVDFTVGYFEGYLEGEIELNDWIDRKVTKILGKMKR